MTLRACGKTADLPLAFHFKGAGHVYARANGIARTPHGLFDCGPHFSGYQSDDNGHFQLYKGGAWQRARHGLPSGQALVQQQHGPYLDTAEKRLMRGAPGTATRTSRGAGPHVAYGNSDAFTYACGDLSRPIAKPR